VFLSDPRYDGPKRKALLKNIATGEHRTLHRSLWLGSLPETEPFAAISLLAVGTPLVVPKVAEKPCELFPAGMLPSHVDGVLDECRQPFPYTDYGRVARHMGVFRSLVSSSF